MKAAFLIAFAWLPLAAHATDDLEELLKQRKAEVAPTPTPRPTPQATATPPPAPRSAATPRPRPTAPAKPSIPDASNLAKEAQATVEKYRAMARRAGRQLRSPGDRIDEGDFVIGLFYQRQIESNPTRLTDGNPYRATYTAEDGKGRSFIIVGDRRVYNLPKTLRVVRVIERRAMGVLSVEAWE
jgi:pyruvate/2-oxoglutarate dehydrogenase complex dihydrolipoamide acyltransferase (E2) component